MIDMPDACAPDTPPDACHARCTSRYSRAAVGAQIADVFAKADANSDGMVDLSTEMTYAHGYYAANADKGGNSQYMHKITQNQTCLLLIVFILVTIYLITTICLLKIKMVRMVHRNSFYNVDLNI